MKEKEWRLSGQVCSVAEEKIEENRHLYSVKDKKLHKTFSLDLIFHKLQVVAAEGLQLGRLLPGP